MQGVLTHIKQKKLGENSLDEPLPHQGEIFFLEEEKRCLESPEMARKLIISADLGARTPIGASGVNY